MKRTFLYTLVISITAILSLGSCGKKELKNVRGMVKTVDVDHDTIRNLTIVCGNDSMVFNLDEARFNNGIMVPHDSVIVDYIDGKTDTARAFIVTVLPSQTKLIDPSQNTNKELITVPEKTEKAK